MSYESFRADFISRMVEKGTTTESLCGLLSVIDDMSNGYEFTPKTTDIIISNGVPDAVRIYIASKSIQNLAKGTLENYRSTLTHFFETIRHPVDEVTTNDIRIYLHAYKQERKVRDATIDHVRIMLNGFYEWCVDEEICKKNPVRRIPAIKCADPERLPMTTLELEKVRKTCKTLREKAMVDFLYSTAARASEFCQLNKSDIDFQTHTVHIQHGKGDKGRTTFMNAEAEVSLRAYLDSRTDDNEALFVTTKNPHRISKKSVEIEVQKIVSRCELSVHVTPHIFRHTAASLALQRGMPIDQVQKFLGHARIQTTLRYAKTLMQDVQLSHQRYVA